MTTLVPSQLYPLVRAFLTTAGLTSTVAAFDKESGYNKVTAQQAAVDLLEVCKEYIKNHPTVSIIPKESSKRKAEEETEGAKKKAKVEEKKKEEKKAKKAESSDESSDSDSDSDAQSSDSDSDSSSSGSDSDSSSDDSSSSSDSDSSSDDSSSESDSDSSSDSSEDEKPKKKEKKGKEDKKDKKAKKEEKKEANGTPSTPAANGNHTPANGTPVTPVPRNTPFRRVTEEDAALLQSRFADNTFESKKGDEYGKKANEILSLVRGKGFRTEKNKKKKGTYRGGPIDLGINSVKFHYDDDE